MKGFVRRDEGQLFGGTKVEKEGGGGESIGLVARRHGCLK